MGHYYVPRKYLENFEAPERPGFVWQYDMLKGGQPRCAAISKVAQEKGFYDSDVETELAKRVETPANPIIGRLCKGMLPSDAEKLLLSVYLGTMLKRVPYRRQKASKLIPEALRDTIENVKSQVLLLASAKRIDEAATQAAFQEIDRLNAEYSKQPPQEVLSKLRMPWPSREIINCIYQMRWRILTSQGPSKFITSDNPVFIFEQFGLGKSHSEMTIALSSTHALHACYDKTSNETLLLSAKEPLTIELNHRVISTTSRFLFAQERYDWVSKFIESKTRQLNRIVWE